MSRLLDELRSLKWDTVKYLDCGYYRLRLSRTPSNHGRWWVVIVLKPDDTTLFSVGDGSPKKTEAKYRESIERRLKTARIDLVDAEKELRAFEELNFYVTPKTALERLL